MAAGVPGAERKFEYKQPIPVPGSTSAYQVTPTAKLHKPAGLQLPRLQRLKPSILAPTSSPQALTHQQVQAYLQQQAVQAPAQVASQAPAQDAYLSQISDESLDSSEHFGAEAPALLNTYACAVEDALTEQVQRGQSQSLRLKQLAKSAAMNLCSRRCAC